MLLLAYLLVVMGSRAFLLRYWRRSRIEKGNKQDIRLFIEILGKPFVSYVILVSIGLPMAILFYFLDPPWMAWAKFPLFEWVRWGGVLLSLIMLPLHVWVHKTLGQGLANRQLVTTGPYLKIRHPMFIITGIILGSMSLIAADLLLILSYVGFILLMILYAPREEQMLLEEYGEQYRKYKMRTGRFLPPRKSAEKDK